MTETAPISRFPTPDLGDLPDDIRARILAVQEKSGFVPNVLLVLARRPDEFRAFFAYHDALMDKPGNLTKAEREMIVVATSSPNQCQYCVVAHGAILRIRAKNPLIADQVASNYRKADITAWQKAMLDFALKVSNRAPTRLSRPTSTRCTHSSSPTRTSGTSPRSPRSSACPTASRTSPRYGRMPSSTGWAATDSQVPSHRLLPPL